MQPMVLIIDFGSQYTQLIARRVRELGVYCEIHPCTLTLEQFKALSPQGIILSGGPASVFKAETPKAPEFIFSGNVPVLGICYGMQTMAAQLGGTVECALSREFGQAEVQVKALCPLFAELGHVSVWMSHGDVVSVLPPGFTCIAETENAPIAVMADEARQFYGVQFHPEVTHTPTGLALLKRFLLNICKIEASWTPTHILDDLVRVVRAEVGADKVLVALSGGVDSAVVAALLSRAIPGQLICVFVDTGLLRLNEKEKVLQAFREHLSTEVIVIDAREQFLQALEGVTCPEAKRKAVGRVFIEVFQAEAQKLKDIVWLAQGTIYPDVIESAGVGGTEVIKSHHNVGGLPELMQLRLLEPVRMLFKDEVRALGVTLGLPESLVHRHPFPGPGLSVRILGEVKPEFLEILRAADAIFIEALRSAGLYHRVSQAFAVFLPVKSVGVMGDGRRYDYVIALRAVETTDFMTATWSHLPWDFLADVSNQIINKVPGISRVTYDISGKPPATIEWE